MGDEAPGCSSSPGSCSNEILEQHQEQVKYGSIAMESPDAMMLQELLRVLRRMEESQNAVLQGLNGISDILSKYKQPASDMRGKKMGQDHNPGSGTPRTALEGPLKDICSKLYWLLPEVTNVIPELKDLRGWLFTGSAMLASATYSAALNPPGGSWTDSTTLHKAGEPVLKEMDYFRYYWFYGSNTAAFAGSLGLIIFLLSKHANTGAVLHLLRLFLAICILSLCFALAAGSNLGSKIWPNLISVPPYIAVLLFVLYLVT